MPATASSERRTEDLLVELLAAQGWDRRRPPQGDVLRQQEYRSDARLRELFKESSKTGSGYGLPEAVLVTRDSIEPLAVIEAKANVRELDRAISEARAYARPCIDAGFPTLAIGIAGTSDEDFDLRVDRWKRDRWAPITYDGKPISWIPNPEDTQRLAASAGTELRPTVPPPEVLAERAEEINRLLREARVLDQQRPAIVGAIMLALWSSKGNIRKEREYILSDVNEACKKAFWRAKKPDLAAVLRVEEENETLAIKARRIVNILELLNVATLNAEHDYLGQLYETFFRYTGGNTIGQYFTPRHVTKFMADVCEVTRRDLTLDPACGTGGFLVAAMNRIQETENVSRGEIVKIIRDKLIGFEDEPVTAALCVANMILRGDGTTGVHRANCFTAAEFPTGKATVGLMNPPFPHRKTDTPPQDFISRLLDGLQQRGRLATIVPISLMVKMDDDVKSFRRRVLRENTLEAVIALPDELFSPFAAANTAIVVITKGVQHDFSRPVFFARIENDGYRIRKGVRLPRVGDQLPQVLAAFRARTSIPNVCGTATIGVDDEWAPGAFVPAKPLTEAEVLEEASFLVRTKSALLIKYAPQFKRLLSRLDSEEIVPRDFREYGGRRRNKTAPGTIGSHFEVFYGQKELETKIDLVEGDSLVISSTGAENGCYGFFDFDWLIRPPFVTVPRTGSIGHAHVQEWPCGASSDNLLLIPRDDVPLEYHYIAAAVLRRERWRFNYGRKMTPGKIETFPMPTGAHLVEEIGRALDEAAAIEARVIGATYDARGDGRIDALIANEQIAKIAADPNEVVGGKKLEDALAEILR